MLKYNINPYFRDPSKCEIFIDKIILASDANYLILHFVDIVGNLGSISLPFNKIEKFINSYDTAYNDCKPLNKETLKTATNEFSKNYKYDSNVFQLNTCPKKNEKIISLNATAIGASYNLIAGCLGFNAYLMLSVIVNYSDMNEYLLDLFNVSEWNRASQDKNMDVWIFLNKNDAENLKKELEIFKK